jgi:TRAP-type C4-dicarboxylate transport system permease large subunit
LFDAVNGLFAGVRGALANATIGSCALFGAICGSSIATAGDLLQGGDPGDAPPRLRRRRSPPARSRARARSTCSFPPSVLLAIYAIVAEQSLPKLYAAAFVPGFVLAALYVLAVWAVAWLRPHWVPKVPGMGLAARLRASVGMWKLAVLFFFAVFGIYLGWFSPTEAAAVAAFVAILIAMLTGRWAGAASGMRCSRPPIPPRRSSSSSSGRSSSRASSS